MTSYADWCAQYGSDWSILFLNDENQTYFENSNDVNREDLYGFFSVAVFKEQVSDLNYWFKNNTGDGQMTIFVDREVKGSGIYQFFDNLTTKGLLASTLGYVGMYLCESIDDSNAIYYSYFFYLDGSVKNGYAYISNGGADDAFDTDDSLGNMIEDVGGAIGDFFGNLGEDIGGFFDNMENKLFQITLGSLGLLGIGILIIYFITRDKKK